MNLNKSVVINGSVQQMNVSDMIDITNPDHVRRYNEQVKNNFKKSFYFGFGVKSFRLGNVVDKFTTITGIKWVIKKIFKECGCEKRKKYLNKWNLYLPYLYYSINLKSTHKELEVAPKTEVYVGNNLKTNFIEGDDQPITREMLKKSNPGCGCNKRKG